MGKGNGHVIANTPIVVDLWTLQNIPSKCARFLTHMHAGEFPRSRAPDISHLSNCMFCVNNIINKAIHPFYIKKAYRELNLMRALDEDTRVFSILLLHWARQMFLGIPPFISYHGDVSGISSINPQFSLCIPFVCKFGVLDCPYDSVSLRVFSKGGKMMIIEMKRGANIFSTPMFIQAHI